MFLLFSSSWSIFFIYNVPLISAAIAENRDATELLLKHGADPNLVNKVSF